jgi:hypothetical protein
MSCCGWEQSEKEGAQRRKGKRKERKEKMKIFLNYLSLCDLSVPFAPLRAFFSFTRG